MKILMKLKKKRIDGLSLIFFAYIAVIVVFAMFYQKHGDNFTSPIKAFSDALYFSVVTITTLGYGDISPTSNLTKLMISIQTVYGIFTFGFLMNAAASKVAERTLRRQIEATKSHANMEYENFRNQVLNIVLGSAEYSSDQAVISSLEQIREDDSLAKHDKFRSIFSSSGIGKTIFYELQNRLDDQNSDVLAEVYLELDILSENINYLLNKVETENRQAHDTLVRVAQASRRYKNSYMYKEEQGKYVGRLLFEIMASYSTLLGPLGYDFIEKSINDL